MFFWFKSLVFDLEVEIGDMYNIGKYSILWYFSYRIVCYICLRVMVNVGMEMVEMGFVYFLIGCVWMKSKCICICRFCIVYLILVIILLYWF